MPRKLLAFDLGTTTGWARNLDSGVPVFGSLDLKPNRYAGGGMRFVNFDRALSDLNLGQVDLVVFEEVRRHLGVDAAHVYGGLMAVLTSRCERAHIPYQGVPVGVIKRHATGKGNANKAAMIEAATDWAGGPEPITEDEADALCLLRYAMETYKEDER